MQRVLSASFATAAIWVLITPAAIAEEDAVTPQEVVAAFEQIFGVHAGQRRNHTKGMCAVGSFVGDTAVAERSRAALFSGETIPVVARFSLAGGDPAAADTDRSPRGMALEFRPPNADRQHMTMIHVPVFPVRTPRAFYELLLARMPDPATGKPDPAKVAAFAAAHPESKAHVDFLSAHNPPASYANAAYHGIHAFRLLGAGDATTLAKWHFAPEDGERELTDAELAASPRDFLQEALIERARRAPVRWTMWITLGKPGDPEADPTATWPAAREQIRAGTLTFTEAMPQAGAPCEKINYDPLVMTDGIAATDDPVLRFRSPAYAVSFSQRLQGR